jgi:hypothetical protein
MKRALVLTAVLLGGCSMFKSKMERAPAPAPVAQAAAPQLVDANGVPIEKLPFRVGTSSATVEKMAREQGCGGGQGAGLVTEPGPIEVYRMQCENGKVFTARCELRQCRKM